MSIIPHTWHPLQCAPFSLFMVNSVISNQLQITLVLNCKYIVIIVNTISPPFTLFCIVFIVLKISYCNISQYNVYTEIWSFKIYSFSLFVVVVVVVVVVCVRMYVTARQSKNAVCAHLEAFITLRNRALICVFILRNYYVNIICQYSALSSFPSNLTKNMP